MHTIFVVFGSTGDLAKRKLFPALYNIFSSQENEKMEILAIGRRNFTKQTFADYIQKETEEFLKPGPNFSDFLGIIDYAKVELTQISDYIHLQNMLNAKKNIDTQIIFYLAISPEYFFDFVDNFKQIDIGKIKVVFEKPFGTDLQTATELNSKIMEVFEETDVYRIDHYVGKEAIQNILAFRFTNTIFEAIWNNKYIDNIQITAGETIGVGERGGYYDKFGALRDMLQNHLFQVLSLVLMDAPSQIDADSIRQEKYKVLRSIHLGNRFENNVVFGQYEGYQNETGVAKNSKTETFVAMKLEVATWNFVGVPIYIRTGKYMTKKTTRIVIEFKEVPQILFNVAGNVHKNRIILEVQPNEGIDIHFNIKQNGNSKEIERVKSIFTKDSPSKEAYQKLLQDVIEGDKTLFTSWDMLKESWRIVDDLVNCKNNCPILHSYKKGTDGPEVSRILLQNDNKKWYE